jgi:predicted GNAT family acetyltransferase
MEAGADECILHTQLANPTSNAIYRRIGYEPVSEVLFYRFG